MCVCSCMCQTLDQLLGAAFQSSKAIQSPGSLSRRSDLPQNSPNGEVLLEMDIMYTREQYETMQQTQEAGSDVSKRKAVSKANVRWTNAVVHYTIDSAYSSDEREQVIAAMREWQQYTCLSFIVRTNQQNYIHITDGNGCHSYLGMKGGQQTLALASACRVKQVIIHELGHAIGFNHEQTRHDRDNYVSIDHDNIQSWAHFNFELHPESDSRAHGVPYDYTSIMHYGQFAFSSNSQKTIITQDSKYQNIIGNAKSLSFADIQLGNIIYSCNAHCGSVSCPADGFLDENCQCMCPGNPVKQCVVGSIGDQDNEDEEQVNKNNKFVVHEDVGGVYLNWNSAMTECQSLGGALADIHNTRELKHLTSLLGTISTHEYWLGGRIREGAWKWSDGAVIDADQFAWQTYNRDAGACTTVWNTGTQLREVDCNRGRRFICKQPLNNVKYITYEQVDGEYLSWRLAQSVCRTHGGSLADIHNNQQMTLLTQHLNSLPTHEYWLGGRVSGDGSDWQWTDGSRITGSFLNWQNTPSTSSEQCMAVWNTGAQLRAVECTRVRRFICQVPLANECEDNNNNCATWAGSDECSTNASWMHVHCKKSCHTCNIDETI